MTKKKHLLKYNKVLNSIDDLYLLTLKMSIDI